jgi:hypothetical protein
MAVVEADDLVTVQQLRQLAKTFGVDRGPRCIPRDLE